RTTHQAIAKNEGTLCLHHLEDITPSYVKTLAIWRERFNHNLEKVRQFGLDERFIRKWNYYKSYCEGAFKTHNISVAQAVFSKPNNTLIN
ncbi:MAG: class I SAM-dependent methyltransferase, partial [Candidatus Omnitrophica bacterium]|nr:class I SAM-dependent methyltransferase [Candidatus Omnitrophota bacterium]